ncbi:MFS transporter [Kyrpidia spormannii]|uniref:MFS transporter n=1 Tax=Kyrpidia spormannii TaxID=2055160 RepID=A0A2K8N340_9BACL|nr:MFS transporter [Kyrpidia spormannii]ATY83886.1 MFS transporter [Kyrpidia spormannii]
MGGIGLLQSRPVQIALLVIVNLFVGGMVGLERTVLPLLAKEEFGIAGKSAAVAFIISFGVVKALSNLFAGRIADLLGRKRLLVAGWVVGLPVPFLVMFAPNWNWVIFANVLLGINQGFCWSMTVNMKIDLAGPRFRGLVLGLNEFAGYSAISITALVSGYVAAVYGVRPQPFYLGVAYALAGLLLSSVPVKDTTALSKTVAGSSLPLGRAFAIATWQNTPLLSASQAGFMTNFKDGMIWGLLPLFLNAHALDIAAVGTIVALYPGTWGLLQLATGPLSDRFGRTWLIIVGMLIQGGAILWIVFTQGFALWSTGSILLGVGTAMVYPTLLAAVADHSEAEWRASALGVYRFWRDFGYAVGALVSGLLADALGTSTSMGIVGVLVIASGLVAALWLRDVQSERFTETGVTR